MKTRKQSREKASRGQHAAWLSILAHRWRHRNGPKPTDSSSTQSRQNYLELDRLVKITPLPLPAESLTFGVSLV